MGLAVTSCLRSEGGACAFVAIACSIAASVNRRVIEPGVTLRRLWSPAAEWAGRGSVLSMTVRLKTELKLIAAQDQDTQKQRLPAYRDYPLQVVEDCTARNT